MSERERLLSEATSPGKPLPPGVSERFLKAGGVSFRYLVGGPTPETQSDVPILYLHGYPTWAEVWLPVAKSLGNRHSWIAPDLPCHHKSSAPPGKDRSISAYRRAIAAFADAIPFPRFAVVGNSLGGALGTMLAIDRPDRVEKLVLIDAAGLTPKFPGRTARLYIPFVIPAIFRAPGPASVRKLLQKAVFVDSRLADEGWVATTVEEWKSKARRKDYVATGSALRRPDASVAADLPRLRIPTLLVWGRQDPQFSWQTGEAAARLIPGARFAAIENCGHFPMVEKPEETARLLTEFLSGTAQREAKR